jgi:LysR family pca operon transcriptional activator
VPDGLPREPLWTEQISILARAGHPLFEQDRVEIEDLRRYELVLPTVTQRVGREIERRRHGGVGIRRMRRQLNQTAASS